jgi:hypothetical protein
LIGIALLRSFEQLRPSALNGSSPASSQGGCSAGAWHSSIWLPVVESSVVVPSLGSTVVVPSLGSGPVVEVSLVGSTVVVPGSVVPGSTAVVVSCVVATVADSDALPPSPVVGSVPPPGVAEMFAVAEASSSASLVLGSLFEFEFESETVAPGSGSPPHAAPNVRARTPSEPRVVTKEMRCIRNCSWT